ncbi:UDP-N-acetyl-D-mannosaminuronic acid dehydrogenase [Patulibacter medicamentivorans]|uniref:UDP-N-acetyl-D-mannosaminuronic acid dehydrogenase n=1 Tax=Patulibacter medicamentivorans TaxID=1097667 RepID=H0E9I2_9ACTN|nr:nucleotide sugar dehydrogenase [Patulibacter medicamentivorans]EHN09674.1 UDP-N-acetyl-D-mannosaminuronic acid dehydrogenase [Patulibacter medicamentivorans]
MRVVVVALGKIGLPLAAFAASHGHEVVGCDIDQRVVDQVNAGEEPFPGEGGLAEALARTIASGALRATTDTVAAVAAGADLILAVPPLVVDADARPEWRALDAAVEAIGRGLARAAAERGSAAGPDGAPPSVVVETTLPVGSTRSRVAPLLERASGLREGSDFHAAHSPERVYSGRIFQDLETYPKLVGGLDATGEARTAARYRRLLNGSGAPTVEVRELGGAEAAELTKLAETTYRDLNIAFANELAQHADRIGVDVQGVIDAANSQPFSHIHRPGVAVGGHCIPVYPRFYLEGDPAATLPAAARAVNEAMPGYAVGLLGGLLDGGLAGRRVLVLGAAYRGDVKETAFSGVFGLRDALVAAGATALVADPLYADDELRALGLEPWDGAPVDGAIVQADHAAYRDLAPDDVPGARAVVDGRGVLDADRWRAAGVALRRIGRDATRG